MDKNSNKKIAILFFGLTRSLRKYTLENIEKHIFQVLKDNNIEYDIYLHTYDLKFLTNKRSKEINEELDTEEWKLLNPDYYKITSQEEFDKTFNLKDYTKCGDPWRDKFNSLTNLIRQLNSLKEVTSLLQFDKNYNGYLYLRPDILYKERIKIKDLEGLLAEDQNNKVIYTPKWATNKGFNDRCYMGTKEAIKIVGNRFDLLKEYSQTRTPHAEKFLHNTIISNGIENRHFYIYGDRVRANGIIKIR